MHAALLIAFVTLAGSPSTPTAPVAAAVPQVITGMPAQPSRGDIRDLDTMVVNGVVSGPPMWKVTHGNHVMWVLGTQSPMPKKMQWSSREVEAAVNDSQEVIWAPMIGVQVKAGFFGSLMLMPKLIGMRKNPDGKSLQDQLPPDIYARWLVLKDAYIGFDWGIDDYRPVFAAQKLWEEALDSVGLTRSSVVVPVVQRLVKEQAIKTTSPRSLLVIDDARAAIGEFRESSLDDIACFSKTLLRLETDLRPMQARADAWAVGDIEALRDLPYTDHEDACQTAMMQAEVVQQRLDRNLTAEAEQQWFDAVDSALAKNASTFALLPMSELLKPDGYMARLQAKGYTVESPSL